MEACENYEVAVWQRFQMTFPDIPCLKMVHAHSSFEAVLGAMEMCGMESITHGVVAHNQEVVERWRMGQGFWVRL
jgi:hypothetical protein